MAPLLPQYFEAGTYKIYSFYEEMKIGKHPSSKVLHHEVVDSDEKLNEIFKTSKKYKTSLKLLGFVFWIMSLSFLSIHFYRLVNLMI